VTSMNATVLLVTTGHGIARAEVNKIGEWSVSAPLPNKDVRCMVRDPQDERKVFAGTQGEGVLCSYDFGATWQPAGLPGQVVKALAISPHDPGTIFAGVKPAGLHVSQDAGKTWTELAGFQRIPNRWWWFSPAEPPDWRPYVMALTVSPTNPNVILAGIELGGVVRSEDGGLTWSPQSSGTTEGLTSVCFGNGLTGGVKVDIIEAGFPAASNPPIPRQFWQFPLP